MNTRLLIAALLLPAFAAAEDYNGIVQQAFESIDSDYKLSWAYTETSLEDELVRVARHDPRTAGDSTWTLVSVDNREPTAEEIDDFLDEKSDKKKRDRDEDGNEIVVEGDDEDGSDIVNFDTLDLIEETDTYWLFSFVPNGEDDDEVNFMKHVDGELKIIKDGHYVDSIQLRNEKTIKPAIGVKIKKFEMAMQFGPAAASGPIVPLAIDVAVQGRAMLLVKFDETESIRYSDYAFSGRADGVE